MACRTPWHFRAAGMSGLFSASPVNVQEAHGYMRAIQQCSTDLYHFLLPRWFVSHCCDVILLCIVSQISNKGGDWRPWRALLNSLIDGHLETFVKSLNDWSGLSDAVKWRWWIPESLLTSDFICEVTEVTLNDTVDLDAWLMNIKLSHPQLNCHFHCTVVSISIPIKTASGSIGHPQKKFS